MRPQMAGRIFRARFVRLFITFDHAELAGRPPLYHREPFDRTLVAQVKDLVLVTRDGNMPRYGVDVMAA